MPVAPRIGEWRSCGCSVHACRVKGLQGRDHCPSFRARDVPAACCLYEILGVEADVSAYAYDLLQLCARWRLIEAGGQAMRVVLDQLAQPDWDRRRLLSDLLADVGEEEVLCRVREAVEGSVAVLKGAIVRQAKDVRGEQRRELSRRAAVLGCVRDSTAHQVEEGSKESGGLGR